MKITQFLLIALMCIGTTTALDAQADKSKRKSPLVELTANLSAANIAINYSSPSVKGRTIWGDLVPYDKVWRAGANEATTFETDKKLNIEGQTLPAGKYALFVIPTKSSWTIVFNENADQWGAYDYKEKLDVLRVEVKPTKLEDSVERMTFDVEGKEGAKKVILKWANLAAGFSVKG